MGSRRRYSNLADLAGSYELEQAMSRGNQAVSALTNRAFISNAATANPEGAGGPTIIAMAALNARVSGFFFWSVDIAVASAAADNVTLTVTRQQNAGGVNALVLTNPAVAIGGYVAAATNGCIVTNGAAGTGIGITAGGGAETTLTIQPETTVAGNVTLHATGFSAINPPPVGSVIGFSFILLVKLTDSVANRAVSGIDVSLGEQPG